MKNEKREAWSTNLQMCYGTADYKSAVTFANLR